MSNLAPPGVLRLERRSPNPNGMPGAELFALVGDATAGPIREIAPAADVVLPRPGAHAGAHGRAHAMCPYRLHVLHFNDLHGHLARIRPGNVRPVFSRIAGRLRALRRQVADDPNTAVLALSAGDDLIGAVFDELLGADEQSFMFHAGYRLYSAAGVDAAVLGNHDLDQGIDLLAHSIRQDAGFPLLSANLAHCALLAGLVVPAVLLVVGGLRVGIMGLTTPAILTPRGSEELRMAHPLRVAQNLLPALSEYADVVIVLSHLGHSLDSSSAPVMGAGDVELAESLPYGSVHLIVGGHTHHVLNEKGLSAHNIVNGIPIVQAGALGRYVGEVDIMVHQRAAVTNARLTPVEDLPADPDFEQKEMEPVLEHVRQLFDRPLGACSMDADLGTAAVRNAFASGESALANFITDAIVTRCHAAGYAVDFAAIDASCVRCGLPAQGALTLGDWFEIMPFADKIRIYQISGEQLARLLHDNARRANRPGEPNTERGFLHFSRQVRYTLALGNQRSQAQARDVAVHGQPLAAQPQRSFHLACTTFVREAAVEWERYAGGLHDPARQLMRDLPHTDTGLYLRRELIAHINAQGGVTAAGGARRDGRLQVED